MSKSKSAMAEAVDNSRHIEFTITFGVAGTLSFFHLDSSQPCARARHLGLLTDLVQNKSSESAAGIASIIKDKFARQDNKKLFIINTQPEKKQEQQAVLDA
jgi:hypothetical protein